MKNQCANNELPTLLSSLARNKRCALFPFSLQFSKEVDMVRRALNRNEVGYFSLYLAISSHIVRLSSRDEVKDQETFFYLKHQKCLKHSSFEAAYY